MNWSNLVKKSGPQFLQNFETDKVIQNDYFKLLLLKVYLQAADGVHLVFNTLLLHFGLIRFYYINKGTV